MAKVHVFIEYKDESGFDFEITLDGSEKEVVGEVKMITRGTLISSNAYKAVAYNEDGFDICAYYNE